jgi:hypothetical protein
VVGDAGEEIGEQALLEGFRNIARVRFPRGPGDQVGKARPRTLRITERRRLDDPPCETAGLSP